MLSDCKNKTIINAKNELKIFKNKLKNKNKQDMKNKQDLITYIFAPNSRYTIEFNLRINSRIME